MITRSPRQLQELLGLVPKIIKQKYEITHLQERLKLFKLDVKLSETLGEKCWCYYELCKMSTELKQLDQAKVFARKCYRIAEEVNENEWCINAYLFLTKIYLLQENKDDAQKFLSIVINITHQIKDQASSDNLKNCLNIIKKMDADDSFELRKEKHRQKKIISMISNRQLKDEYSHLFQKMSVIKANRRFNIVPKAELVEERNR